MTTAHQDPVASPESTAAPEPTAARPSRDEEFVGHLRQLCANNAGARSALRRADTAALADRALPYLAAWNLTRAELEAAQLFGALIARHGDVRPDPSMPLGKAAFQTLAPRDRSEPSETGAGRRVIACQRQSLKLAHRTFTGLLTTIEARPALGVDWTRLWRTYRTWDHPDPDRRRGTRQRLLLDFYGSGTDGR